MNQLNLEDHSSENQLSPVVSAASLFEHLKDDQVVIVDCRFDLAQPQLGREHYQTSHIPGAFYLDLNQDLSGPVQQHGGRHPLPEPEQLAAKLEAIGVRSGNGQAATWVIAYDDSRFAFAARLWWLLRFLGHDRAAVLDGGFAGWQAAGYPVTSEDSNPKVKPGAFIPRMRSNWVVDMETVKTQKDQPEIALIDSREADRYRGEREPIDPVAGHIPGAINYPWTEVTNSQGYLRPSVQKQWASLAGIKEIIVYCGSGVTACVNLLSLEMAGYQNGKLYAGSWSDWCSYL
jgi:thiosulfate/3-mercaptopyruvate sulfurtransferase